MVSNNISTTNTGNAPTYMTTKNFIQNSNASVHYTYNANGAMVTDANNGDISLGVDCNRGIVYTEYDTFGYPKAVYFRNGCITNYVYTHDGQKLQAKYTTPVSYITQSMGQPFTLTSSEILSTTTTDYWGADLICKGGYPSMFLFDGGYADIKNHTTMTWHYYVKDHLGSNRIVQDENGKVETSYNYYPFGNTFEHHGEIYGYNKASQPYTFCGKEGEWLRSTYDFGARQYDPLLCRWTSIDPLCEKYYSVSPYAYCHNNPVNMTDPNGMTDYKVNSSGQMYEATSWWESLKTLLGMGCHQDRIFMEGSGKQIVSLPENSIQGLSTQDVTLNDGRKVTQTSFTIAGNANANKVYNALTDNTQVEWAAVEDANNKIDATVLTNHNATEATSGINVLKDYESKSSSVTFRHSHFLTQEDYYGSEFERQARVLPSREDMRVARLHPNTKFYLDDKTNKRTLRYDGKKYWTVQK